MSRNHLTLRTPQVDPSSIVACKQSLAQLLKHVDDCHRRCLGALGSAVVAAYEAGQSLNAYRDQFKHGEWEVAVQQVASQEGLAITLRTCQRYMKVASILTELLTKESGDERPRDPKATRASLLRIMRKNDLLSINKVLEFKKAAARRTSEVTAKPRLNAVVGVPASNEAAHFLTPAAIHSAVVEFFKRIDVDPCGSTAPDCRLSAVKTLAPPSDGLAADIPWNGNVYVHPPLDQVLPFVERTVAAVTNGEAESAIVLVPAVTDTDYAGLLQPYARGFLRDRPIFLTPSGDSVTPQTAYMLVFVSRDDRRQVEFAEAFGHLSDIYYAHRF